LHDQQAWNSDAPATQPADQSADEPWHLRTTYPIESTFATVRHRTKITKGPGSCAAGALAVAFKVIESAQDRWRAVNAPQLVAWFRHELLGSHREGST
jgi:hypothetical protein